MCVLEMKQKNHQKRVVTIPFRKFHRTFCRHFVNGNSEAILVSIYNIYVCQDYRKCKKTIIYWSQWSKILADAGIGWICAKNPAN